jgi:ribonuclease J
MRKEELLETGILPKVPGLFDDSVPQPDAILLSHAHEDHTGLIQHSQPGIPVYAGVGTSKMMLAGSKFARQPRLPRDRHHELTAGQTIQIGEFTVTVFSVDHSIYGAQAFLIEADGKAVLYSGDLRLHGPHC